MFIWHPVSSVAESKISCKAVHTSTNEKLPLLARTIKNSILLATLLKSLASVVELKGHSPAEFACVN